MTYFYRLAAALLLALSLGMIWTPAHAAGGWRYLSTDACSTAAAGAVNMLAAFRRVENGVRYDYVLTATNEANGRLDGTRSETTLSTGVTVDKGAWSYVLLSCTPPGDITCQGIALLDSTAFGSRDVQIPGEVSSGEACMPFAGTPAGTGCKVAFARDVSYRKDGAWVSEGTYSFPGATSASCVIAGAPRPAEVDTCKGGQPGQVNGVTVCVPFAPNTPTVSDTKKDSSTTGPTGTETKSEVKSTVCDNGSCNTTTTTTTTNSSGTSVTTNTTTQGKGEYCSATPGAKECTGKSAFAGDCAAGFTYDGDAIQGAIAKEVYNQNCIWNKVTPESAKYDSAKVKTGNQTTDLPGNETVAISSASFDKSNALGAGSCISNLTLNVLGSTLILPLSSICSWLAYFRYILLAVGFFMAYRIVFGK